MALREIEQQTGRRRQGHYARAAQLTLIDQLTLLVAGHAAAMSRALQPSAHLRRICMRKGLIALLLCALAERLQGHEHDAVEYEDLLLALLGELNDHDPALQAAVAMRLVMVQRDFLEWEPWWETLRAIESAHDLKALAAVAMYVYGRNDAARTVCQHLFRWATAVSA